METNEEIKDRHKYSLKGILPRYIIRKFVYSWSMLLSISISITLWTAVLFCCEDDLYFSFLSKVVDLILNLLPSILGFCIGGYALIIGAGNLDVLRKMADPMQKRDWLSFFQIMSCVFAASLVIQCFTLLISFVVKILIDIDIPPITDGIAQIMNAGIILVLLFLSTLSITLLHYTVINIFNFGQSTHLLIRIEKKNKINNGE